MTIVIMNRTKVPGILLILSCQKHRYTRMKNMVTQLPESELHGWKIVFVLGDNRIGKPYTWSTGGLSLHENVLTINCEDSYIHLLKKLGLALDIIGAQYDVQYGVLRMGDDLILNRDHLTHFLAKSTIPPSYPCCGYVVTNTSAWSTFMPQYYAKHPEDFANQLHGLVGMQSEVQRMTKIPVVRYMGGVIYYVSSHCCRLIVDALSEVGWNVLFKAPTGEYPFIIEDVGVGYILAQHKVPMRSLMLYADRRGQLNAPITDQILVIGEHTNVGK